MRETLESLGMTGSEINTFLASLELGPSKAGSIVKKSQVQNAVVHRALQSLIGKGLITTNYEGRIRIYQAIEPEQLLIHLDEKRAQLAEIIPLLKKKQARSNGKATLYEGSRGVKECMLQMLNTKTTQYYAYGGPQKAHDLLGDFFWKDFHVKRVQKNIHAQLVFRNDLLWWARELSKQSKTTVRISTLKIEEQTETVICGHRVAVIVYGEKPYAFLIEDPSVAQSYAQYFRSIWKDAKILKH
jgi:sugar-specific transcriptional regulator TrmB